MPTVDLGSVVGPQGPQGATGPQGPQGIQGDPGPNAVSASTATNLNGVLAGNGSNVTVRAVDTTPTSGSGALLTSGGAYDALQTMVRPNLIDNWYFAGGGSQLGAGVFPINQRGLTSYINVTYAYTIDRWKFNNNGTLNIGQDSISFTNDTQWDDGIAQPHKESFGIIGGRRVTVSFLFGDGTFYSETVTAPISSQVDWHKNVDRPVGFSLLVNAPSPATFPNGMVVSCGAGETISLKAVKLELGDHQTLAHQDSNGNWILNEIPQFQEQLFRCQTSTADPSDTYANKTNVVDNYYSRPNLLDNPYFVGGGSQQGGSQFPINQRGQTSYSGASYGIDRWTSTSNVTVTLNQNNVTVAFGSGYEANSKSFSQKIGSNIPSGRVNISYLVDEAAGNINVRLRFTDENNAYVGQILGGNALNGMNTFSGIAPNGAKKWSLEFRNSDDSGGSVRIAAAKLELGDHQTLAHQENGVWVLNEIPDYTLELAKCQRYYLSDVGKICPCYCFSTSLFVKISTPTPMRANPIANVINHGYVIGMSADLSAATSINTLSANNDGVVLRYSGTGATSGSTGVTDGTISINLSADL